MAAMTVNADLKLHDGRKSGPLNVGLAIRDLQDEVTELRQLVKTLLKK